MNLTREQVTAKLEACTASVWRLEARQRYNVPAERERLAAYAAGTPLPPPEPPRFTVDAVAAGKAIGRVHIVELPLSDYLRWELSMYRVSVDAGEDVRIARRDADPALDGLTDDFLLLDDAEVVWVRYTDDDEVDRWTWTDAPEDVDAARTARRVALRHAVPLSEFAASLKGRNDTDERR